MFKSCSLENLCVRKKIFGLKFIRACCFYLMMYLGDLVESDKELGSGYRRPKISTNLKPLKKLCIRYGKSCNKTVRIEITL